MRVYFDMEGEENEFIRYFANNVAEGVEIGCETSGGDEWVVATFNKDGILLHSCVEDNLIPTDTKGRSKVTKEGC